MHARTLLLFIGCAVMRAAGPVQALEPPTPAPAQTPNDASCGGAACSGACSVCPPCTPGTICPGAPCSLGECQAVSGSCACVVGNPAPTATPPPSLTGARGCIYVANLGSNNVSVIDSNTNSVIATIPVGDNPDGIAVSVDGTRTYVADFLSNDVSVIDNALKTVVATIPVGAGPVGIATQSPNAPFAYVALKGDRSVAVVDTAANTLSAKITVDGAPQSIAVAAWNPFTYYVTESFPVGPGDVAVIDTSTNTVTAKIAVGVRPNRIALSQRASLAYVTNFGSFSISVIDLGTNSVTGTIGLSLRPSSVAITPDGRSAYLTSSGSFSTTIIQTQTGATRASIPVGTEPSAIAMVQSSPFTYVTNFGSDTVSVIARNHRNDVIATIPVGHRPFAAAIGARGPCVAPTPLATASPTPSGSGCACDCNGDDQVTVDEILTCINIALGNAPIAACPAFALTCPETGVECIVGAVDKAVNGCGGAVSMVRH